MWSSDAGQTHSPPSTIVMKEQAWHVGDEMKVVLIDSKGEVSGNTYWVMWLQVANVDTFFLGGGFMC